MIIDQYVLLGFSHGKKFVSFKQLKLINAFCCYFRPIDHDKGSDSNCNGIYVSSQVPTDQGTYNDFFIMKISSTFMLSDPSFSLIRFYTKPIKFT